MIPTTTVDQCPQPIQHQIELVQFTGLHPETPGRTQVVDVCQQACERHFVIAVAQFRAESNGMIGEETSVGRPNCSLDIGVRSEPVGCVVPDGLQHGEPAGPVCVCTAYQALGHERCHYLHRVDVAMDLARHRLDRFES